MGIKYKREKRGPISTPPQQFLSGSQMATDILLSSRGNNHFRGNNLRLAHAEAETVPDCVWPASVLG